MYETTSKAAVIAKKTPPTIVGGVFMIQLLGGVDRDLLAVLAQTLEADNAVRLGEQGVVAADTDVDAGMDVGAALANKNVARENELTVGALGTKALGLGVAAVLGRAHTFFMSEELKTNVHHNS